MSPCPWCWLAGVAREVVEAWNSLDLSSRRSLSLMAALLALVLWTWWSR